MYLDWRNFGEDYRVSLVIRFLYIGIMLLIALIGTIFG